MGKCEVTQDEWEQVMSTQPSKFHGAKTLPVENITWAEATQFGGAADQGERSGALPAGWEFRLPTDGAVGICRLRGPRSPTASARISRVWEATGGMV